MKNVQCLIDQCFIEKYNRDGSLSEIGYDAEKLAELIINECAELTLDYKNDDHYYGWIDYRVEIRNHFGIS